MYFVGLKSLIISIAVLPQMIRLISSRGCLTVMCLLSMLLIVFFYLQALMTFPPARHTGMYSDFML